MALFPLYFYLMGEAVNIVAYITYPLCLGLIEKLVISVSDVFTIHVLK